MKFKSQRGVTGIDLVIAISIIILAVGTISTIYVNINKSYRATSRSSVAGKIATDIIAAVDVSYFLEINQNNAGTAVVTNGNDIIQMNRLKELLGSGAADLVIPTGYTVEVEVTDAQNPIIAEKEFLKRVDIKISYKVSGESFSTEFVKYKGRYGAIIPERPEQNFTDTDTYKYTPIKYNKLSEQWETTVFGDATWYEYRENYWPIMVRSRKDVQPLKDGQVNRSAGAEVYVWLPQIVENSGVYFLGTTITLNGVTDVYSYKRQDKNTIGDDTVIDDREVDFEYDEVDYSEKFDTSKIVITKGWYKFDFTGTLSATKLDSGTALYNASDFFIYNAGDEVDEINMKKEILVYRTILDHKGNGKSENVILGGMVNYPK